jgi:hypothetical protein
LHAGLAALAFYRQGRGALIELALKDVAAHCILFCPPREGWRARTDAWTAHLSQHSHPVTQPRARQTVASQ